MSVPVDRNSLWQTIGWIIFAALLLWIISGCQAGPTVNRLGGSFSTGIAPPEQFGEHSDVVRIETGVVQTIYENDPFAFDLGLMHTVTVLDGLTGTGAEVFFRPRIILGRLEPFVLAGIGSEYYFGKPSTNGATQGTNWGFAIQGGVGARLRLSDRAWFTGEVRLFHHSNGSEIFGHGFNNPGFNSTVVSLGMEWNF